MTEPDLSATTPTPGAAAPTVAPTGRPSTAAVALIGGRQLLIGLRFLVAMTVVCGVLYPLVVLGIGQLVLTHQANGSPITAANGQVAGSARLGQQFEGRQWFIGRPSAAGDGYDAMSSGGTNLAADSEELARTVAERRTQIAADNGVVPAAVPADAITASASGLDPDISPAYALIQVNRVAAARGLAADQVRNLVESSVQGRILGFIGEERVNVLQLNLALAALAPGSGG